MTVAPLARLLQRAQLLQQARFLQRAQPAALRSCASHQQFNSHSGDTHQRLERFQIDRIRIEVSGVGIQNRNRSIAHDEWDRNDS